MNELGQSILDILIKDCKQDEAHEHFKRGIENPETMNRRTYGCFMMVLMDNQVRCAIGLEPVNLTQEQRTELRRLLKLSDYLIISGVGVVRSIRVDNKGKRIVPAAAASATEPKPASDTPAVKKPRNKNKNKKPAVAAAPASTPAAVPVEPVIEERVRTLTDRVVTFIGGDQLDRHYIETVLEGNEVLRAPNTTAVALCEAKKKLDNVKGPRDIEHSMMDKAVTRILLTHANAVDAAAKADVTNATTANPESVDAQPESNPPA